MLDSSLRESGGSNSNRRAGQAYALWPMPLRHGDDQGELALYFHDVLKIRADLHVVSVQGWRRDVWFDLTGLPWVRPSRHAIVKAKCFIRGWSLSRRALVGWAWNT